MKCAIPYEQVEKDAIDLIPFLDSKSEHSRFTLDDVVAASQMYDEKWYKMSWKFVKDKSGLDNIIPKTKRNGRKQSEHLKRARVVQQLDYPNGSWREGNGRPTKKTIVQKWRENNPSGTKYQCAKETGLSKNTIKKWWSPPASED